ncbi:uncharacterized protein LOC108907892 [Anoplophora glabripennis]|uniref:uncharacterized protein LOC108907892 n=1 Tax=Anoplophora glabripennis TaxID=217634 RepID=UPI0008740E1F|nr:uncharacterized protein LOC108907892 [Anoplophora glabripennis]
MNVVVTIFTSLLALHILTFAYSLQGVLQLKPTLKRTFHYELLHPKLSNSAPRSVAYLSRPVEISTPYPPLLPSLKLPTQPPLVPDILNNLFQQGPKNVKEISNNHLDHLFTPNTINEPAVTLGQIENYNKDLEELAKEEREQNKASSDLKKLDEFDKSAPKLHVSVNSGLYNYNYTLQKK